jgi:autotransporter-associated beta strand protein
MTNNKKRTLLYCSAVFVLFIINTGADLYGQHEVTISSYSILTTPSSGYPDTGGMELTDGTVPTGAWGDGTTFDNSPYVGWENNNKAKITFNFSGTQQLAAIRLTLSDSDGSSGVALPTSMVVDPDNNSTKQTIPIPNPSGAGVRQILLPLYTVYSGSSLTIELTKSSSYWIMLAEVEVFSSVPMDGDFTISNSSALSYAVPFAENTDKTGKLIKNGNGALTLSGNNTFTGGVIVNTTGTSANSSKIVAGSDAAFGTGTIELKGTTNGTGSTLDLNGRTLGNDIAIEFRNTGISGRSLENSNTTTPAVLNGDLAIGGANYVGGAGDITLNGLVSGGKNNNYSFFKQDTGTWTFANPANTFDGFFYLIGGEVEVNTLADDGVASSLGQISSGINFFKFGFNGSGGGILRHIGSTASTSNRAFRFLGSGTGASNRIEANGTSTSATLNLTGTASAERSGTYNFSLSGTNTGDNTYNGVISNGSGTVSVLKEGTGTWRLTGANTYTGGTTINGGRLIGNATSIKGVNVPNNSELELDQATAGTLGSNILGTGAVFKTGAGALTLSGSNSYTGGTTISAGRLIGASVNSIAGNILNNSELEFAQSSTVTFAGAISGTGTLYKTGAGTLTLSGNSSYTGGTTFNAGTLTLGNDNSLGTGDLTIAGTGLTLSTNAARTIPNAIILNNDATIANGTHAFTANGAITGTGKLTKTGTGTLTLGGNNTFSGGFTIQGGSGANSIIKATSSNAFGTGTVEILGSSGNTGSTLDLNGQTLTNDITIGNKNSGVSNEGAIKNTDTSNPATLNGTVMIGGENYAGGDGDIIFNSLVTGGLNNIYSIYKMGSGTWRFTNNANTFDGFFYLIDGEVEVTSLANAGQASSLGQVSASQNLLKFGFNGTGGGTLRFVGNSANSSDRAFEMMGKADITNRIEADGSDAAASFTLTGNISPVRSGNYTLALGGNNMGNNTYSGLISNGIGTLALVKEGTGTWRLTGANTYSGTTTITAGTLQIGDGGSTGSIGTGNIVLNTGATLAFNRNNSVSINNTWNTLTGGGTQTLRNDGIGLVTLAGSSKNIGSNGTGEVLVITGSGDGLIEQSFASDGDPLNIQKEGAGTWTLSNTSNGFSGTTTIVSGTLEITGQLGRVSDGVYGNYAQAITNDGQLHFNSTSSQTLSGSISGSGLLRKSANGILTLSGNNTYSGGTEYHSGGLIIGNDNALGTGNLTISGNNLTLSNTGSHTIPNAIILNNDLSIASGSDSLTLTGNISGSGKLSKTETGILTLTGSAHTYTGATEVMNGELRVNGDISSSASVTVEAGATISGTGTFPAMVVKGTQKPGNSPGIHHIQGALTYEKGAEFEWELSKNAFGKMGVDYDGILVEGPIKVNGPMTLSLVFNDETSEVDWKDSFWSKDTTLTWPIFELIGEHSSIETFHQDLIHIKSDWKDKTGATFNSVFPHKNITPHIIRDQKGIKISLKIWSHSLVYLASGNIQFLTP